MPIQRKVFRVEQAWAAAAARPHRNAKPDVPAPQGVPGPLWQLQQEADAIHHAIFWTKQEIATLHAGAFGKAQPHAARELDAVVDSTERAAHQIMDAAELIAQATKSLSASKDHGQELTQEIRSNVLRIFEACNFQDISGQRIAKVLATLHFVEQRINRMMEIWGGADALRDYAAPPEPVPGFLHGPKLAVDSDHISQADIDALLATS